MRQSELSTPPSEPQLTPRRLARADAIAALRGDGPPAALLRPDSEVSTPRAESTLDEVPGGPAPITGTIEAARFPQIARGTYDIAGKFAQGGIGRILRAYDPVLGRTVALKELLVAGHRTDEERFVREVLLTARLQHPGIVPVYAAGRWPSGEPFYAMKLVSGRSFDQVIAEATALPARLALLPHVLAIAETVAFAHAQGIIHRDLKPNNVLVGEFGETVVIDWGLAKQLGEPDDAQESHDADPLRTTTPPVDTTQQLTHVGAIVGTPGFMSPEQADSNPVDARTDVYALGVILYQTLTGRLPYESDNAVELLFKTVYEKPIPLQTREPHVPEELAAIVETAMARDLGARYPTAKAFADDLRRFQTGQIVGAHRYTAWELLRRVIRRYRTHLTIAAVAVLIVIVTLIFSFRSVATQRDLAREAEAAALAAEADAVHARNEAVQRADVLALEQARLRVDDDPVLALDLLFKTSPGADWRRIRQIAAAVEQRGIPMVLHGHRAAVSRAVFSPDNTRLATTSDDCTVRVWDLARGTSRAYFGHTDEVWRVAWSADQRRVATTSRDRTVRVWDLDTGAAQVLSGHAAGIRNVTFGPGGRTLYSGDDDKVLRRWDLDTGAGEVLDEQCLGSSFVWDERQIACVADQAGEVRLLDLRTGERTRLRLEGDARGVALGASGGASPDGRWVAAGTTAADAVLWDRVAGDSRRLHLTRGLTDAGGLPREIRFAPGSDRMLVPMARDYLAVHDLQGRTTRLLRPHTGYTRRASFSPDGGLIASVGGDIGVHVWDEAGESERSLAGAQALMIDVQFSRDGEYLAAVGNDPRVFVWPQRVYRSRMWRMPGGPGKIVSADAPALETSVIARGTEVVLLDTRELRPRLRLVAPRPLWAVGLAGDATLLAGLDDSATLHVWDGQVGALQRSIAVPGATADCLLHGAPRGAQVAIRCDGGPVAWVDLASGELRELGRDAHPVVDFLAAGDLLFVGDRAGQVRSYRRDGGQTPLYDYAGPIQSITRVPNQDRVIVSSDRVVDVWDPGRMTSHALTGHTLQVDAVHVSADGRRVVTSSRDNVLRVFDLATGELLRSIIPDTLAGGAVRLSDDGGMLASSNHESAIQLWDLGGGPDAELEPRSLLGHSDNIKVMRFAPDSRSLLVIDGAGRAVRWADELPRDPDGVRAWVAEHHDPEAAIPVTTVGCISPGPITK